MRGNVDGINNDYVQGWAVDEEDPSRRVSIDVLYNGELLTRTLAGFPRPDLHKAGIGDGSNGFYVALPTLQGPEEAEISVAVSDSGEPLGEPRSISRRPQCSPRGLLAHEVLALHATPLHALQALEFDGQTLRINGIHLPPGGDPFSLRLRSTPGTPVTFHYPLHAPGASDWYWYWPNVSWSSFRIEIDVSACTDSGPFYDLWFESEKAGPSFTALGRNHLRIPKDLNAYQNFPGGDQLTRVHRFDHSRRVAMAAYNDFRQVVDVAEQYGVDLATANVLDWGCGHGRMIRHFAQRPGAAESWGVDIDAENVSWLQDHVGSVRAATVPLHPPTELPDQHFDLVYAISVMTHLTWDVQEAWLRELRRITRPGGLVLLTFAGRTSAAFASRFLTPEWVETWEKSGFDDTMDSVDLNGKIGDDDYYRNTKQTPDFTRDFWGRHFEVLDIHESIFGYQDVAVLRA
jgi:SAM-dependent methyltransferase